MCHEYEAWWWAERPAQKKKVAEPPSVDMARPAFRPEAAASPPEVKADDKELVPAE